MPYQILVIDDMPENLVLISALLHSTELTIVTAQNGRQALDFLLTTGKKIDLIITDWQMPEMDGEQLIILKNADPNLKSIPTLLCSMDQAADAIARRHGAAFLGKWELFAGRRLKEMVFSLLRRSGLVA